MGYNFTLGIFIAVIYSILLILNTLCLFPKINRQFLTFLALLFLSLTTLCKITRYLVSNNNAPVVRLANLILIMKKVKDDETNLINEVLFFLTPFNLFMIVTIVILF